MKYINETKKGILMGNGLNPFLDLVNRHLGRDSALQINKIYIIKKDGFSILKMRGLKTGVFDERCYFKANYSLQLYCIRHGLPRVEIQINAKPK